MKTQLLNQLVKDLETKVTDRKFDMQNWKHKKNGCGTVGCAIGHYCMLHPRASIKLIGEYSEDVDNVDICFNNETSFEAIATYFNIPLCDAEILFQFCPLNKTRKQVIKNIKEYVKTGKLPAKLVLSYEKQWGCLPWPIKKEEYAPLV